MLRTSIMPFGADITNKFAGNNAGALPSVPKKSAASLACIANGNLRSRRVVAPVKDKTDEYMQDASAIMSIASVREAAGASDVSMASAGARGDTTVCMREPSDGGVGDGTGTFVNGTCYFSCGEGACCRDPTVPDGEGTGESRCYLTLLCSNIPIGNHSTQPGTASGSDRCGVRRRRQR